jgi:hypothetical protein
MTLSLMRGITHEMTLRERKKKQDVTLGEAEALHGEFLVKKKKIYKVSSVVILYSKSGTFLKR